jgi:hypothetical protein
MRLPTPRGPISEALVNRLSERVSDLSDDVALAVVSSGADPIADEDLQIALWVCYELHYRGFDDVSGDYEWDLDVLRVRRELEREFLAGLKRQVPPAPPAVDVPAQLVALIAADDGPALSRYLERKATRAEFLDFVVHRSVYHLKEADPHSWAIPRLSGSVKAAFVAIQSDEYGAGLTANMHSELFRATMRGLALDDSYGHYVDAVPGVTLAVSNLISLFGLHRSLRGALVGHLAAFEMTSSLANRAYSRGLRRLGVDRATTRRFFDEHVTADALHEQLAAHDLCGGLVANEPNLGPDVLFGAACCLYIDNRFAAHVLGRWREGRSSLLEARTPQSTAS